MPEIPEGCPLHQPPNGACPACVAIVIANHDPLTTELHCGGCDGSGNPECEGTTDHITLHEAGYQLGLSEGRQLGIAEARLEVAREVLRRLQESAARGAFAIGIDDARQRVDAAERLVAERKIRSR